MRLYADPSALLKLYVEESSSAQARETLGLYSPWVTAAHSLVEVRRGLWRILKGRSLTEARRLFQEHWNLAEVVQLDEATCERAAELAEQTGARTLDALHLAAAERAGGGALRFLTYDARQAEAARSLGWEVLGA